MGACRHFSNGCSPVTGRHGRERTPTRHNGWEGADFHLISAKLGCSFVNVQRMIVNDAGISGGA